MAISWDQKEWSKTKRLIDKAYKIEMEVERLKDEYHRVALKVNKGQDERYSVVTHWLCCAQKEVR